MRSVFHGTFTPGTADRLCGLIFANSVPFDDGDRRFTITRRLAITRPAYAPCLYPVYTMKQT